MGSRHLGALTMDCRTISVMFSFADPGCPMSGTYGRFVMVKLRVNNTKVGLVAATTRQMRDLP